MSFFIPKSPTPKKIFEIEPEKEKEIEEKLKRVGEKWEKIQEEWENFKKYWWRGFFGITSILFFITVIRTGAWPELYIWLITMIIFTAGSLYQYRKKAKIIKQLKKLGFIKEE